ncbi:MAG: cytochrome c3 family protein [Planctomycetota bacterium]
MHYTTIQGNTGDVDGASRLCLSCHDGVTAMDNYGGNTGGTQAMTDPGGVGVGDDPVVGLDLQNDHPIGVNYPPATGQYALTADVISAGLRLPNDGTNDRVECQSCHDPHLTTNGFFLRISNDASGLCTACHTL